MPRALESCQAKNDELAAGMHATEAKKAKQVLVFISKAGSAPISTCQ